MTIFPAIDLKDGQCVRLVQGRADRKTVYSDQPEAVARKFAQEGAAWLHVVDLDGAFTGSSRNLKSIEKIAQAVDLPFQVGGGLRSRADVKRILELGAARVIIGTKAVSAPEFIRELLENSDRKIVLGIDARKAGVQWRRVSTAELRGRIWNNHAGAGYTAGLHRYQPGRFTGRAEHCGYQKHGS